MASLNLLVKTTIFSILMACLVTSTMAKSPSSSDLKANSTTTNNRSRGSRSGFEPGYGLFSHGTNGLTGFGRQDMIPLIPIALLFGLGLMLIPFLSSFIAQVLSPPPSQTVYTGRKKRSASTPFSISASDLLADSILSYFKVFEKSIQRQDSGNK